MNLYELTEQYETLLDLAENNDDSIDYEYMLVGMEGAIDDKLDAWCKVIKSLEANEAALSQEMARLSMRKSSISNQTKKMKDSMKAVMIRLKKKNHKSPLFTVSVSKARERLEVIDIDKVPIKFKILPAPVVDKKAVLAAIKANDGKEIQGVKIVTGEMGLTIR